MWLDPSSFYNIKLVNLKSIHIQKHLNQIESKDTAKKVYLLLSTFFKYCFKERIIIYSPLDNVSSPKVESTDTMKYLSRDSVALLTDAYKKDKKLLIYILDLMTGLRQGELCALTHADIDFNDMTVDVNKSLVRVSVPDKDGIKRSTFQIGPPKTKAGIRKIPLPKSLVLPLKEHIVNEKKKHLKLGTTFSPDNPLFTTRTCTYLRGDHLNKRWKNLQEKLNIDPVIPFHGIRHTFCTMVAEKGVPLKTAATLMGHAKVETTARVYTHVDQKAKEDAVQLLEGIL